MLKQKNILTRRCAMLAVLLFMLTATNVSTKATTDDCILPKYGPWPACAIDGDPPPQLPEGCVIPESGPWPPCATAGNTPPIEIDANCIIPASGPWPPCATAGNTPPIEIDANCVIPASGPWPPCATGGRPDTRNDPPEATTPPSPDTEWIPNSIIVRIDYTNDDQMAMGDYVHFMGDLKSPSTPIRLQWHIAEAETVTFNYTPPNYSAGGFHLEGESSGEFILSHDPTQGGTDALYTISTDNGIFTAINLALPCEYVWNPLFTTNPNHPAVCPVYDLHMRAFQQNFEGGIIVWFPNVSEDLPNSILVVDWSGYFYRELTDTYIKGVDPIKDVTLTPPEGMYQPEYSVGKVWRNNLDIREKLGWATDRGQFYTAHQQGILNNRYVGLDYISLYGDGFIGRHYPQPWIVQP